jgi:4-amino-4-deoxy-L-arabinose transferase-like glycosyltransferase
MQPTSFPGKNGIILLLLLGIALFNLCWNIVPQAVEPYDEGRHAATAVEMLRTHDFLINRYMGEPDYWNAKPPLSFWGAVLGLRLLPDPFAGVRFFSLISALLSGLLVFLYTRRIGGNRAAAIAVALLVTAPALTLLHAARTADPDMLFAALVCAAFMAFSGLTRWSAAAGYALLGLGFLAKSFHAVPYGMAAFLFCAWRWRQGQIRLAELLLLPLCFLLPVMPWALARYHADGIRFFQIMFFYDLVRRSTHVIEHHNAPAYDYFVFLLREFGLAVIAAFVAFRATREARLFSDPRVQLVLIWLLVPFCLYTAAKSRMEWYTYPLFPACAILLGLMIDKGLAALQGRQRQLVLGLLLVWLAYSELFIAERIIKRHDMEDPVLRTMLTIKGNAERPAPVYIEIVPDMNQMPQDYYASSLLVGGMALQGGGRPGFLLSNDRTALLITTQGALLHR